MFRIFRGVRFVLGVALLALLWLAQACYLDAETQCSSEQDCVGGQRCEGKLCICPEGRTFCTKMCADTKSDALHCGACGVACPKGQSCRAGACQTGKAQCTAQTCSNNEDCEICENAPQCVLIGGSAGFCQAGGNCPSLCSTDADCAPCGAGKKCFSGAGVGICQ